MSITTSYTLNGLRVDLYASCWAILIRTRERWSVASWTIAPTRAAAIDRFNRTDSAPSWYREQDDYEPLRRAGKARAVHLCAEVLLFNMHGVEKRVEP